MKIVDVFKKLLRSPNLVSQAPIYEKYDKNVQGNTVHERGQVAASITVPFRDFVELPEAPSKIGVAIATGGNPNLAKISAREATKSALAEAVVKLSCVGAFPLGATDCLNFGNPEKPEQMGAFVEGIEGLREVCEALKVPIVSGNVSLYNETRGTSIPPSALIAAFGRVDQVNEVPTLRLRNSDESLFLIGARSQNFGGSEFLNACEKEDARIPMVPLEAISDWTTKLRELATDNVISTAHPISSGGLLVTLAKACLGSDFGATVKIPAEEVLAFLFSEDLGVLVATDKPEIIEEVFKNKAIRLGQVAETPRLLIFAGEEKVLDQDLLEVKTEWEDTLRDIV